MNAAKEGTENMTTTHGRTETYGSHFIFGKIIIIFTGTIISVTLIIVILREFYKYRRFIGLYQENNPTVVIYANEAQI